MFQVPNSGFILDNYSVQTHSSQTKPPAARGLKEHPPPPCHIQPFACGASATNTVFLSPSVSQMSQAKPISCDPAQTPPLPWQHLSSPIRMFFFFFLSFHSSFHGLNWCFFSQTIQCLWASTVLRSYLVSRWALIFSINTVNNEPVKVAPFLCNFFCWFQHPQSDIYKPGSFLYHPCF